MGMAAGTSLSGLPQGPPPSAFLPCWTATQRVTYPTEPLAPQYHTHAGLTIRPLWRQRQGYPANSYLNSNGPPGQWGKPQLLTYPDSSAPQLPLAYSVVSPCTPSALKQLPPPVFVGTFFVLESRTFFEGSVCTSFLLAGLHTCMVGASLKVSSIPTSYSASPRSLLPAPQYPVSTGNWQSTLCLFC